MVLMGGGMCRMEVPAGPGSDLLCDLAALHPGAGLCRGLGLGTQVHAEARGCMVCLNCLCLSWPAEMGCL